MREITFHYPVHTLGDFPSFGLPEIGISGRSNVGKSSMINRLAGQRHLAKTSRKPGKTRSLNYYFVDKAFFLVDLPGYGYAKVPKSERRLFEELVDPYLNGRRELVGIIQLIDIRHGPVSGDLKMLEWLEHYDGNILYVFTKADKLSANRRSRLTKQYKEEYAMENIVIFSASTGTGTGEVWSWIYNTLGMK